MVTVPPVSVFGLLTRVFVLLVPIKDLFGPMELTIREVLPELIRFSEPAAVRVFVLVRVIDNVGPPLRFCTLPVVDLSAPIELTIREVLPRLTCLFGFTVTCLDVRKFVPAELLPLEKLRVVVVLTVVLGVLAAGRLELTLRG